MNPFGAAMAGSPNRWWVAASSGAVLRVGAAEVQADNTASITNATIMAMVRRTTEQ